MAQSIYIETTIPSLYVSRPSAQLIEAARQQMTRTWWDDHRHEFEIFSSQAVIDECSRGEAGKANERLAMLANVQLLDLDPQVAKVAIEFVDRQIIPTKAAEDALHIAATAVHSIDYLITWNFKHIANPRNWSRLADCLSSFGYPMPIICTPEELLVDEN